ncbi:MAG: Crp/Fnr family transcriptional regulator, partial [Bilophila wadsworthia]
YIEPGCLFREIVLLHVSPSHPASLVALEPCEVYNFPRTLLDDAEFVRRHPALMSNLVHSLGAKAGAFYSQITESVELDPQTQVCRYLHRLADERRTRVVNPGVSQSELALVLGLHRSTVCRIIRTLRDRGVLGHFTRCSLEILDREALAELCNPSEGGK